MVSFPGPRISVAVSSEMQCFQILHTQVDPNTLHGLVGRSQGAVFFFFLGGVRSWDHIGNSSPPPKTETEVE